MSIHASEGDMLDRERLDDQVHALLAHACRHMQRQAARPPRCTASAAHLRAAFERPLGEHGCDAMQVIDALVDAATPGLMGNTGGNFFGWVMGASSPVGMAADVLTTAWGQNAAIYQTSPAAAVAEEVLSRSSGVDSTRLTDQVIAEVQRENTSFVAGADWKGRRIMRVSVISRDTSASAISALFDSIVSAWGRVMRRRRIDEKQVDAKPA